MGGNPDRFIDEIAGYYIPDMHEANGFGLSENVKKLRTGLLKQGFANADKVAEGLKRADPSFALNEQEMNAWGYQLLSQKKAAEALSVLKLNATLFPKSANAYDSLGEIQELTGNKKEALLSYQQSLTLNPGNKNAANRIAELSGK
jgi:tetratricopeptide (TPR) repeat protein